jgi:hypothetical protein
MNGSGARSLLSVDKSTSRPAKMATDGERLGAGRATIRLPKPIESGAASSASNAFSRGRPVLSNPRTAPAMLVLWSAYIEPLVATLALGKSADNRLSTATADAAGQ